MEVVTKKKKNIITYKKTNCRQGGCATVYDACYRGNDGFVIKILKSGSDHKKIARFKAEVRETIKLQDKVHGIIPILEYEIEQKNYWYIMPKAQQLRDHIESKKNTIVADDEKSKELKYIIIKVKAVYELAVTLRDLHSKDIHHRDIKPLNLYYYDGKYCFGDFGLIDYPQKEGVTTDTERVGPQGFMPDEMYRNTKNADYKKVDVYELAKTFWSILTEQPTVFHGKYDEDDKEIGVSNYFKYSHHLVEIEEILTQSTEFIPALRPSSEEFIEKIKLWFKCIEDQRYRSVRQWQYINSRLFPQIPPATASFTDLNDIVSVLSRFCKLPDLNHTFLPNVGGLDLRGVKKAGEEGCIELDLHGLFIILKPEKLLIENFNAQQLGGKSHIDPMWSYARLDTCNLKPIFDVSASQDDWSVHERLTEVAPGKYDSWLLDNYGRDWNGEPLSGEAKEVERYLNGSFVFFNKASAYYNTSATYDARHNIFSSEKFRELVEAMRIVYNVNMKLYDETFGKQFPGTGIKREPAEEFEEISDNEKRIYKDFVAVDLCTIDFSHICSRYLDLPRDRSIFFVEVDIYDGIIQPFDFHECYLLDSACKINKYARQIVGGIPKNALVFPSFSAAKDAVNDIYAFLKQKCIEIGVVNFGKNHVDIRFELKLFRNFDAKPTHLFTLDEVQFALRTGNDSKRNSLVVTDNGFCRLIDRKADPLIEAYPLHFETFQPYNNYVGRFTNIEGRKSEYLHFLYCWYHYLKDGSSPDVAFLPNFDEQEMIDKIREFY